MIKLFFKRGVFFIFLLFFNTLNASLIVQNDGILNLQVSQKIEEIGLELYEKTSISLNLAAIESLNSVSLDQKASQFTKNFKSPYIFLMLVKKEHKVEIYNSPGMNEFFDKEQVLSPFSNKGTIIPILTSNKGKDIYNAALLNGYADIADQVAYNKSVKLNSSIGSSNKNTLNLLRLFFYGSVVLVLLVYFYRKFKERK